MYKVTIIIIIVLILMFSKICFLNFVSLDNNLQDEDHTCVNWFVCRKL